MAATKSIDVKFTTYPNTYLRLRDVRPNKDGGYATLAFDLFASKTAFQKVKKDGNLRQDALVSDYFTVQVYAESRKNLRLGPDQNPMPQGGTRINAVIPDVARLWDDTPANPLIPEDQWPKGIYAQGWLLFGLIPEAEGWLSTDVEAKPIATQSAKKA